LPSVIQPEHTPGRPAANPGFILSVPSVPIRSIRLTLQAR